MTIRRDELRKTDFSDISSGKRLAPVHPGDVLLKDFIEPMGISRYRVAKNINVSQRRIDLICRGEAALSAEMALRLGRLFGMTPEFRFNLQAIRSGSSRALGRERDCQGCRPAGGVKAKGRGFINSLKKPQMKKYGYRNTGI